MKKQWMAGLVLILCLVFFSGCGNESRTSGEASPEEPVQAESNDGNLQTDTVVISVTTPEGWTPVEGSVLPVQYMKDTASFMVKEEGFAGDNLDDVVSQAKSSFESAFDNVQYLGEIETVTVDGIDARKLIFTCDVSGLGMKYEYVYLFAGNAVYAITFADLAETFDGLASDYDAILGNISF